jgi:hypothetical protein
MKAERHEGTAPSARCFGIEWVSPHALTAVLLLYCLAVRVGGG